MTKDLFGFSVSINGASDTIVVSAPEANNSTGYVKVYKLISDTWVQYGNKISGESIDDVFGYSLDINFTGDIIAISSPYADNTIGYVKVYKFNSGDWFLLGNKITGNFISDIFGFSISINDIGDTIVISAHGSDNYKGYVKVYKYKIGLWIQKGDTLTGEHSSEHFGHSVSINDKGNIIAIGAFYANNWTGYVKVYKLINDIWIQQGNKLPGDVEYDFFGVSVSINSSGDIIAIGSYGSDTAKGYVKVYKFNSGDWFLLGNKITGNISTDFFGYSISINSIGNVVVIGAYNADNQTGYVKVYKYISGIWLEEGKEIHGEHIGEHFGNLVSINSTGDILVSGAYGGNSITGYVKVHKLVSDSWIQQGNKITS